PVRGVGARPGGARPPRDHPGARGPGGAGAAAVAHVEVTRIEEGLWRWTAVHPDWTPEEGGEEGGDPVVGCVYCECGDALLLIDPLAPDEGPDAERFWAALDGDVERLGLPVAALVTVHWHERSAAVVLERYGAAVWAHADAVERLEVPVAHP